MKAGATDLTVVVDRSGSMGSIAREMCGGFDSFIAEQRKQPGTLAVSLLQFDSGGVEWVYQGVPVAEVSALVLIPRGLTPLWDAVGRAVTETGERLAKLAEADRPEKVLVMTLTDGQENHSREWTAARVRDLVKTQREVYKWDFMFLGANIDSFAVGGHIAMTPASTANYTPDAAGVKNMMANVGMRVNSYRGASAGMAPQALAFTDAERTSMDPSHKSLACKRCGYTEAEHAANPAACPAFTLV